MAVHLFHRERGTGHVQEKAPEVEVPQEDADKPAKDEKPAGK